MKRIQNSESRIRNSRIQKSGAERQEPESRMQEPGVGRRGARSIHLQYGNAYDLIIVTDLLNALSNFWILNSEFFPLPLSELFVKHPI
jgi:predicted neutral ceramidase superfamily lipid hydrolase